MLLFGLLTLTKSFSTLLVKKETDLSIVQAFSYRVSQIKNVQQATYRNKLARDCNKGLHFLTSR